jgi:steroid delta-isomerase-like uncharacterized protein
MIRLDDDVFFLMAVAQYQIDRLERNKELVRRVYDALNRGAIDEFGSYLSEDFREMTPKGKAMSKAECLAENKEVKEALPDVRYEVRELIAEGDSVAVVEDYSGTMKGAMRGIEPTGRRMSVAAVELYVVKNGKVVELHGVFDTASMMEQLGLKE